jgi:acyl-CoA thioesterase FadM/ketosteroid isomerase-like protein
MVDLSTARRLPVYLQASVEPRFIDANGHMNVAWYIHLFDRAVWAFFGRHGVDEAYRQRTNAGMFAVEEQVRYLAEVREGEVVEVHMGMLELMPKGVRLRQYLTVPARDLVAAARDVTGLHVDMATRRTTAVPVETFAQLRAAPVAGDGALDEAAAKRFARAWIETWNRRDVESVLAHYADDAVFISPKAETVVGHARVEGKAALRHYWQTASARIRTLSFTLDEALWSAGDQTLTVVYQAALDDQPPRRAVEIMRFRGGQIVRGEALYGAAA